MENYRTKLVTQEDTAVSEGRSKKKKNTSYFISFQDKQKKNEFENLFMGENLKEINGCLFKVN